MDICCSNAGHHTGDYSQHKIMLVCTYMYIKQCPCFQINVVFLVLVLRSIFKHKSKMSKTTEKSMEGKKEHKEKEIAK